MKEKKKIRILMGILGATKSSGRFLVMLDLFDRLDRELFDVTFLADTEHPFGEERVLAGGAELVVLPRRRKEPLRYRAMLREAIKNGNFDVCHIHLATASNIDALRIAKEEGVPLVIAHSHNCEVEGGWPVKMLHELGRHKLAKMDILRLTCADKSGPFMYGKGAYTVIPNAVDQRRFAFSETVRKEVRASLGIDENTFVLGQISRMMPHKNHAFTLRLMQKILQLDPGAKLLFLGDGPMRQEIGEQVDALGMKDAVIFTGSVSRPEDYCCAMDLMILPSLFEGFPLSVLEGLANGLPIFLSDTITKEVVLCDRVQPFSLEADLSVLAEQVLAAGKMPRQPQTELLRKYGFDAELQIQQMEQIYRRSKGE